MYSYSNHHHNQHNQQQINNQNLNSSSMLAGTTSGGVGVGSSRVQSHSLNSPYASSNPNPNPNPNMGSVQGGMAYTHPENSYNHSAAAYNIPPKRYPSAAPSQQQQQQPYGQHQQLGRSNTISSNHHHHHSQNQAHHNLDASNVTQNDFSSTSATANTGSYSRRRVPSVESFRSAVPSPYMGSQVGNSRPYQQQNNHQYAASEYTPSSAPRDRGYIRGNNEFSSRHGGSVAPPVDYSRAAPPAESYNNNNAYSNHTQNRQNDSYRDQPSRPGYDRPQSRAPPTTYQQSHAPPAPASEAGYRPASSYPPHSSTYNSVPSHQGNFASSSAAPYQGPPPPPEASAARPDSRMAPSYEHPNNTRNYEPPTLNYEQQRGYNTQPQHHQDSSVYRPPSSRPDQLQPHHNQDPGYHYQPQHTQEPLRVYKSRSTMSLKASAHPSSPAVASSMAPANNPAPSNSHFAARKGSMDEKHALPESLRTHSKKIEGLLHSSSTNNRPLSKGAILFIQHALSLIN